MIFKIKKEEILKILKISETIINKKNNSIISNPIFLNSYLEINKKNPKIISNNGILNCEYNIDLNKINIEQEGNILLKASIIYEIINKLDEEWIEFNKIDETILLIKTKNFNAQINLIDASQYPISNINKIDLNNSIELTSNDIETIISKISWSTLQINDQIKPISGIYIDTTKNPGFLTCVSTDSYKITYLKLKKDINNELKIILNPNTLKIMYEIAKITNNQNFNIALFEMNKLLIVSDNIVIVDKLIIGDYPIEILENAFNINPNLIVNVNKKIFLSAIERGKIFLNNDKNPFFNLFFKNNMINLEFNSYEFGNAKEQINTISFEGEDIKISFNSSFLINLLNAIDENEITLKLESNLKPMIIESKNQNFKELILPTRN